MTDKTCDGPIQGIGPHMIDLQDYIFIPNTHYIIYLFIYYFLSGSYSYASISRWTIISDIRQHVCAQQLKARQKSETIRSRRRYLCK